ncbi:hypothetical protein TYRP_001143 [Tyrophagus putrescentiae]|nr:hypothetical protein TYRP_001143 [Tyrophagus putrescentiae]
MSCAMLSLESAGWTMRVPSGTEEASPVQRRDIAGKDSAAQCGTVGPEASATSSTEGATGALALPAAPALLPEPGPGRSEDDRRRSMVLTGAGIQAGERFRKNHRLDIRGRPQTEQENAVRGRQRSPQCNKTLKKN